SNSRSIYDPSWQRPYINPTHPRSQNTNSYWTSHTVSLHVAPATLAMADLEPLDGHVAKRWLRQAQMGVSKYLKKHVTYFRTIGSFVCEDRAKGAVLVVVLEEGCPYQPGPDMTNERVEEQVNDALLGEFHPFPLAPDHTLYTAFANLVVVKEDHTSRSGFAAVSWPSTIKAPRGEYGDEEHRSRLVLPEIPADQEHLADGPLPQAEEDSESPESSEDETSPLSVDEEAEEAEGEE
ncbi:hypothetical protein GGR53DRAFT_532751, partial [Hypoxylon sp. FL1150]